MCSKVGYGALWGGDLDLQLWPLQRLREERAALYSELGEGGLPLLFRSSAHVESVR